MEEYDSRTHRILFGDDNQIALAGYTMLGVAIAAVVACPKLSDSTTGPAD